VGVSADTSASRYKALHGRFTVANNFLVKLPVRHPYLTLKELQLVQLRPEIETRGRFHTRLFLSSI
jgi:hypothetical protein